MDKVYLAGPCMGVNFCVSERCEERDTCDDLIKIRVSKISHGKFGNKVLEFFDDVYISVT